MDTEYNTLSVTRDGDVVRVNIHNPPMNLLDFAMLADLDRLGLSLQEDKSSKVVVFSSAVPGFFIAHADLRMFVEGALDYVPRPTESVREILGRFQILPQAVIGQLEGRAIGGGAEFLMALDMVFASREKAVIGLFEVALGAIPGAGGTQFLPRMIGRGRALEAVLGCDEFDADTAAQYGWINRALPHTDLPQFVDRLARRLASFPRAAIREAKFAVNASQLSATEGLNEESRAQVRCAQELASEPSRMARFLDAGGQTPEFEIKKMREGLVRLSEC